MRLWLKTCEIGIKLFIFLATCSPGSSLQASSLGSLGGLVPSSSPTSHISASSLPRGKLKPTFCDALRSRHFKKCFQYKRRFKMSAAGYPYAEVEYHLPKYLLESIPQSSGSPSFFTKRGVGTFDFQNHSRSHKGAMQSKDLGIHSFNSRVMTLPGGLAGGVLSCFAKHQESVVPMLKAAPEKIEKQWRQGEGDWLHQKILAKVAKPLIENPELCTAGSFGEAALGQIEAESGLNVKKYGHIARDSMEFYNQAISGVGKFFPPFKLPEVLQDNLFATNPTPPYLMPCNGWGFNYPRSGTYYGSSELIGSVSSAMKMQSLGKTAFKTIPPVSDEKVQMVYPRESGCFTEGKPIKVLEENVHTKLADMLSNGLSEKIMGTVISGDRSDMPSPKPGEQYVVWQKVMCDTSVAQAAADIASIDMGLLVPICDALEAAEAASVKALEPVMKTLVSAGEETMQAAVDALSPTTVGSKKPETKKGEK